MQILLITDGNRRPGPNARSKWCIRKVAEKKSNFTKNILKFCSKFKRRYLLFFRYNLHQNPKFCVTTEIFLLSNFLNFVPGSRCRVVSFIRVCSAERYHKAHDYQPFDQETIRRENNRIDHRDRRAHHHCRFGGVIAREEGMF